MIAKPPITEFTKIELLWISLVKNPVNPHCRFAPAFIVKEKKETS